MIRKIQKFKYIQTKTHFSQQNGHEIFMSTIKNILWFNFYFTNFKNKLAFMTTFLY